VILIVNGLIFSPDNISIQVKLVYGIAMIFLVMVNVAFLIYRIGKQMQPSISTALAKWELPNYFKPQSDQVAVNTINRLDSLEVKQ
jgi:hypothetical protein